MLLLGAIFQFCYNNTKLCHFYLTSTFLFADCDIGGGSRAWLAPSWGEGPRWSELDAAMALSQLAGGGHMTQPHTTWLVRGSPATRNPSIVIGQQKGGGEGGKWGGGGVNWPALSAVSLAPKGEKISHDINWIGQSKPDIFIGLRNLKKLHFISECESVSCGGGADITQLWRGTVWDTCTGYT